MLHRCVRFTVDNQWLGDSLFDAVVEDFGLSCIHGKNPVESEAILLRPRAEHGASQLDGLKVVIEGDNDLAAFARFDRVWWSKPAEGYVRSRIWTNTALLEDGPTNDLNIGRARHCGKKRKDENALETNVDVNSTVALIANAEDGGGGGGGGSK